MERQTILQSLYSGCGSTAPQTRLDTDATPARALAAALLAGLAACSGATAPHPATAVRIPILQCVQSWAIQLQGLEDEAAVHRLETAAVDMLVVEPMRSQHGLSQFAARTMVRRLQQSAGATMPHKRCIAYLNVGQAEAYRAYWRGDWTAPTRDGPGSPPFLLGLDPDGWEGNYPVAFWDPAWRSCLWGAPDAPLDQILADGFEGVYLDWILGFDDPLVVKAAAAAGVDPAAEMVRLLADLRDYARARYPLFVLIAQNGVALCERDARAFAVVDALAQEDVSFKGRAGVEWHDRAAGDIPAPAEGDWSTSVLCARLGAARERGLAVFTLDYALEPEHAEMAAATSRRHGFVPCVTHTPLDRLPEPLSPASPGR